MPAMALLDRDGVYGAPRFHFAAQKKGLKAHVGAEIHLSAKSKVQSLKSQVGNSDILRTLDLDLGQKVQETQQTCLDSGSGS